MRSHVFFSFAFPGGCPPKTPGLGGWWAPNHTALEPAAARLERTWSFGRCLDGLVNVEREPANHDCTAIRAVGVGVRPEPVVGVRGRAVSSSLDQGHSTRLTIGTQPRSASLGRGSLTSSKHEACAARWILAFVPMLTSACLRLQLLQSLRSVRRVLPRHVASDGLSGGSLSTRHQARAAVG